MNPTSLHVLSNCKVALEQGRYTWRHNSVLLVLKQHLVPRIVAINRGQVVFPRRKQSPLFVDKDGKRYSPLPQTTAWKRRQPVELTDYLRQATDWQIVFDLSGRDNFTYSVKPPEIASSALRQDCLVYSKALHVVLSTELTCPKEERVQTAYQLKEANYDVLAQEAQTNGWTFLNWPIEVGCRGFVAESTVKVIQAFVLHVLYGLPF